MFKSLAARTIATLASLPATALLHAADTPSEITLKPVQAVVLTVGGASAVAYFLAENDQCKIVVTAAKEPNTNHPPTMLVARIETTIADGASTNTNAFGPSDLAFKCRDGARALGINLGSRSFADVSR